MAYGRPMNHPSGPILTVAEMQAAEEAAGARGVSLAELMERAGSAVADAAARFGSGAPALILCGPGNNGGDGYVAARILQERGVKVRVAAFAPPRTELAQAAAARWSGPVVALEDAEGAPVLIDALFGTGLTRPLSPELKQTLTALADAARFVLAVDVPSGIGTDDGAGFGAVPATLTLALGALKPAHLLQPAASLCGHVRIADIGIVASGDARVLPRPFLSSPSPRSHKYWRGYAVVVGGAMGGAAMLSARAAMRLAGYVAITGARRTGPEALVHRRWEDVAEDPRVGAFLIGPGLGRDEKAKEQLARVLATKRRLVLDADALMILTPKERDSLGDDGRHVILTPHDGEFATLFDPLTGSRIDQTRAAAAISGAVVVLKGANTIIAAPDGRVSVAPTAPGWLASAGTGDVLAGLAVAALSSAEAPFVDSYQAACTAVWLHGQSARNAGPALIADDLPMHIPAAVEACL